MRIVRTGQASLKQAGSSRQVPQLLLAHGLSAEGIRQPMSPRIIRNDHRL